MMLYKYYFFISKSRKSEITLSIANTNDSSLYRIYNTFGQLLQEGTLQSNKEVISVSQYTVGIYFIVVKNTATKY